MLCSLPHWSKCDAREPGAACRHRLKRHITWGKSIGLWGNPVGVLINGSPIKAPRILQSAHPAGVNHSLIRTSTPNRRNLQAQKRISRSLYPHHTCRVIIKVIMPLRNPFSSRRPGLSNGVEPAADENHKPPAFEKVDTIGSKASSALSIGSTKSQEPPEYKLSGECWRLLHYTLRQSCR
jgi:hypothetical protein